MLTLAQLSTSHKVTSLSANLSNSETVTMPPAPHDAGLRPSLDPNKTVFDWLPFRGVNPTLSSVGLTKTGGKSTVLRVKDIGNLDDTITTLMSHDRVGTRINKYNRALEQINANFDVVQQVNSHSGRVRVPNLTPIPFLGLTVYRLKPVRPIYELVLRHQPRVSR